MLQIVQLLENPAAASQLAAKALAKIHDSFGWEQIGAITVTVYTKLIAHEQPSGIIPHQKEIIK